MANPMQSQINAFELIFSIKTMPQDLPFNGFLSNFQKKPSFSKSPSTAMPMLIDFNYFTYRCHQVESYAPTKDFGKSFARFKLVKSLLM